MTEIRHGVRFYPDRRVPQAYAHPRIEGLWLADATDLLRALKMPEKLIEATLTPCCSNYVFPWSDSSGREIIVIVWRSRNYFFTELVKMGFVSQEQCQKFIDALCVKIENVEL